MFLEKGGNVLVLLVHDIPHRC